MVAKHLGESGNELNCPLPGAVWVYTAVWEFCSNADNPEGLARVDSKCALPRALSAKADGIVLGIGTGWWAVRAHRRWNQRRRSSVLLLRYVTTSFESARCQ